MLLEALPNVAGLALQQGNMWGPIIEPVKQIGMALIPLALAVVIIMKFAFSDNGWVQAEAGSRLRSVMTGALIVLLAVPMLSMMTGWMPGASALPGSAAQTKAEPKDPSEMNCDELIEHYRPKNEKEDIENARKNPPKGMTPEEAADQVRQLWDAANKKRCFDSPVQENGGKWVSSDKAP